MTRPRPALLAALMAAGIGFGATSAQAAMVLLDLDFNSPVIAAAGNTPDAAANVHGLPAGTSVLQPGTSPNSWVNIRRHDNGIDGGTASNNNFDNFFNSNAGNFLVLGDSTGNLGGDESGTSSISIPFSIPVYGTSLTIQYRWVFDTDFTNTANEINSDDFDVDLIGTVVREVQSVGAPVQRTFDANGDVVISGTRGNRTRTFTGAALTALLGTDQALRFQLVEATGTGSSAVGIDNIQVSFVPEPASLALVGIALLGVGALSRRGGARA